MPIEVVYASAVVRVGRVWVGSIEPLTLPTDLEDLFASVAALPGKASRRASAPTRRKPVSSDHGVPGFGHVPKHR
jgi:hypothetical protein